MAFVILQPQATETPESLRQWVHNQVGKMQRLSAVQLLDELPRSAIGKVLKRDLRDGWTSGLQ